jgi:translation initiation factor 4E
MFKEGVKPMWEDEFNKRGGKFSFKLKKDYTTIIWEEIVIKILNRF